MKLRYLSDLGKFVLWQKEVFRKPENWGMYYKELIRQMYDIGIGSLPIVLLIAVFLGAVTVVQFYYQMEGTLIPPYYIGYIVRDMMIIELAPMVTCLVLAGNVGSTMAAEIGGMRQKEHIDAMEIMGLNTSSYLIMPKLIAGLASGCASDFFHKQRFARRNGRIPLSRRSLLPAQCSATDGASNRRPPRGYSAAG